MALNVPLTGAVPMAKVRASPLASVPARVMAVGVLDVTGTLMPALATGAVLLTVTLTLPVAVLPWPSLIV